MITLRGGPLAGRHGLQLRRRPLPIYLRFVKDPHDTVDALDQLDDKPSADELIYVYRKVSDDGCMHVNSRDKKGRHNGGFFQMATYKFVEPQPSDDTLRQTASWRAWVEAERTKTEAMP